MAHLLIRHKVADYATWRPIYDADDARRRANGEDGEAEVFQDADDPNMVTLIFEWDTVEDARKFAGDPKLAEVMKGAGVIGMPEIYFLK